MLIKDINGDKIALSLKFEDQNPWLDAAEKYAAGQHREGRIARMTDFGAFIELEPGVDALLHVSQISRAHVDKPSDVLSVGRSLQQSCRLQRRRKENQPEHESIRTGSRRDSRNNRRIIK